MTRFTTLRRSEHAEQVALMQMVQRHEAQYPDLKWVHAVPNGGNRDVVTGARMKAEGQKKGVPDLRLDSRRGTCPGIVIELKADGGRLTPEQAEWLSHYADEGWTVAVCYGADAAWDAIKAYVELPK